VTWGRRGVTTEAPGTSQWLMSDDTYHVSLQGRDTYTMAHYNWMLYMQTIALPRNTARVPVERMFGNKFGILTGHRSRVLHS
jgi:hypothetical protein